MKTKKLNKMAMKYEETFKQWTKINKKLYDDCAKYIIDVLNKLPNKRIDIGYEDQISVPYDGGNHPEYASNCFSCVESVYLCDGSIYLDTEDCDKYSIENINASNLHDVAESVKSAYENNYEEVE